MIGRLAGILLHRGTDQVLIDVRGVGYIVYVSERTLAGLPSLGEAVSLYTDLVVREGYVAMRLPYDRRLAFSSGATESTNAFLRGLVQPGDLILTYSMGYMSNVFLPGVFKHGITFVGSPRQRHKAGMAAL